MGKFYIRHSNHDLNYILMKDAKYHNLHVKNITYGN